MFLAPHCRYPGSGWCGLISMQRTTLHAQVREIDTLIVQVGLGFASGGQWAGRGVVAYASDEQLLRREARDNLATIAGDHQLLFDTCRRPAITGGPEGLQREDHALLN